MKTKLLIATGNGWHTEDGFEIDLPFMPHIGMQIRLNEKNMAEWEKMLYESNNFNMYAEDYGFGSNVEDVWKLTTEQCRKIFTNGFNTKRIPYFSIEDVFLVDAVYFKQGEKNKDSDVLYVVMSNSL
jgi:hypothetical protein